MDSYGAQEDVRAIEDDIVQNAQSSKYGENYGLFRGLDFDNADEKSVAQFDSALFPEVATDRAPMFNYHDTRFSCVEMATSDMPSYFLSTGPSASVDDLYTPTMTDINPMRKTPLWKLLDRDKTRSSYEQSAVSSKSRSSARRFARSTRRDRKRDLPISPASTPSIATDPWSSAAKGLSAHRYTCIVCQEQLSSKDVCKRHLEEQHVAPKIYTCEKCAELFETKKDAKTHSDSCSQGVFLCTTIRQEDKKLYACGFTGEHFDSKTQYLEHLIKLSENTEDRPAPNLRPKLLAILDNSALRGYVESISLTIFGSKTAWRNLQWTAADLHKAIGELEDAVRLIDSGKQQKDARIYVNTLFGAATVPRSSSQQSIRSRSEEEGNTPTSKAQSIMQRPWTPPKSIQGGSTDSNVSTVGSSSLINYETASSVAPSPFDGLSTTLSGPPTSALISDLQHQVTLKSLALQTLQSEYASLFQTLQHERVKSQTIDKKASVADQEVNELRSKNEDLTERIKSLEAQLGESEIKRESERLTAASERDQWIRMLELDRELQPKRTQPEDQVRGEGSEALQSSSRVLDSSAATSLVSDSEPDYEETIEGSTNPPGTFQFPRAIHSIVRDLQLRVKRLSREIDLRKARITVFSQSTPRLMQSAYPSSDDSPVSQTPQFNYETNPVPKGEDIGFGSSRSRDKDLVRSGLGSNQLRRCRSLSPRAANSVSPARRVLLVEARASSEPPNHQLSCPLVDYSTTGATPGDTAEGQRSHGGGQTQEGNPNFHLATSSQTKRGREGAEDGEGDQREDERRESNTKRRKILAQESQKRNARFPCIFHIGEPDRYQTHSKRHEYISNLLRHLKSHNFFVCSKCFTKFECCAEFEMHDQNPCAKSCKRKNCIRHVPRGVERQQTCNCVTSPEQQWKELFRIQYPSALIPDVFEALSMDTIRPAIPLLDDLGFDFALPDILEPEPLDGFLDDAEQPTMETPNIALTNSVQVEQSILLELQELRQTIQQLEQRSNQPSERESDLEMVLGMVWQALVRSGSSEALPEAPLFRLVRKFARNIINTADSSQVAARAGLERSAGLSNSITAISSDDWMNLYDDSAVAGSSQGNRSDSGYQT